MLREQFEKLRLSWGNPLKINSGFRCQKHNDEVGGVKNSRHAMGMAIDISTKKMNINEKADFLHLANTFFDYVQIYPTFIHMHVEPEKHR